MGERTKFVRENAKKHGIIGEKMTETERKFYQNSSKSWLSAVRSMETRGKKQLLPSNGNLFAYAANNPVKYTDPDGRDNCIATFNRDTGEMKMKYYYSGTDNWTKIPNVYSFNLANHVRNELNGERKSPDVKTTPSDGSKSQYYFPRKFPLGTWRLFRSKTPTDSSMGTVFIPTDAKQDVPVYGEDKPLPDENGKYTPTGVQSDTAYGFHKATNVLNPTSLGCGVSKGENAQQDVNKMAEISDKALSSGGKSIVIVTENN